MNGKINSVIFQLFKLIFCEKIKNGRDYMNIHTQGLWNLTFLGKLTVPYEQLGHCPVKPIKLLDMSQTLVTRYR